MTLLYPYTYKFELLDQTLGDPISRHFPPRTPEPLTSRVTGLQTRWAATWPHGIIHGFLHATGENNTTRSGSQGALVAANTANSLLQLVVSLHEDLLRRGRHIGRMAMEQE